MVMDSYLQHKHTSFRRRFIGVLQWSVRIGHLGVFIYDLDIYSICGHTWVIFRKRCGHWKWTQSHNLGRVSSDMTWHNWHNPPLLWSATTFLVGRNVCSSFQGFNLPCWWLWITSHGLVSLAPWKRCDRCLFGLLFQGLHVQCDPCGVHLWQKGSHWMHETVEGFNSWFRWWFGRLRL